MEDDAMARPEVTGRKVRATGKRSRKALQARAPPDEPSDSSKTVRRILYKDLPAAAYTIATFCVAHDISESFYHKLKSQGRAPREMHVGTRVLISYEAAADWRAAREAETSAALSSTTNDTTNNDIESAITT
jgi:hypothetical protein